MIKVKQNIDTIYGLIGKRVHFISDCSLFPINEVCKVLSISDTKSDEKLIKVRVIRNNKIIKIGTNMSNLMYEMIK